MSVDAQIEDIRLSIAEIHRSLYKFDRQLETVYGDVDTALSSFDSEVAGVVRDGGKIFRQVNDITSYFPSYGVYLAVLLVLDAIVSIIVAYLIYYVVKMCRNRHYKSDKFLSKITGRRRRVAVTPFQHRNYMLFHGGPTGKRPPDKTPIYDVPPDDEPLLPFYVTVMKNGGVITTFTADS